MEDCRNGVSSSGIRAEVFLERVCLPLLGFLGIVGNLGAIFVQLQSRVKSNFNHSLLTLSVINVLFVSILILDTFDLDMDLNNQEFIKLVPWLWHPLKNILLCFETFMIMSIATERYQAVMRPILFRQKKTSSCLHLFVYILPPMVGSVVVNIPKFLETELITFELLDTANISHTLVDYNITLLGLNPAYNLYYSHWTVFLTTGVIPFMYLTVINLLICMKIKSQFKIVSSKGAMRAHSIRRRSRPPMLPLSIFVTYLVCNIPRLVLIWTDYILQEDLKLCPIHWLVVLPVRRRKGHTEIKIEMAEVNQNQFGEDKTDKRKCKPFQEKKIKSDKLYTLFRKMYIFSMKV